MAGLLYKIRLLLRISRLWQAVLENRQPLIFRLTKKIVDLVSKEMIKRRIKHKKVEWKIQILRDGDHLRNLQKEDKLSKVLRVPIRRFRASLRFYSKVHMWVRGLEAKPWRKSINVTRPSWWLMSSQNTQKSSQSRAFELHLHKFRQFSNNHWSWETLYAQQE